MSSKMPMWQPLNVDDPATETDLIVPGKMRFIVWRNSII
jgi:hypothetical protein